MMLPNHQWVSELINYFNRLAFKLYSPYITLDLEDVECVQKCIDSVVSNTVHILHHLLPPKNISRYNFGNQRIFVSKNVHLIVT